MRATSLKLLVTTLPVFLGTVLCAVFLWKLLTVVEVYLSTDDFSLLLRQYHEIPYCRIRVSPVSESLRQTNISRYLNSKGFAIGRKSDQWKKAYIDSRFGKSGAGEANLIYRSLYAADREEALLRWSNSHESNAKKFWTNVLTSMHTGDYSSAIIILRGVGRDQTRAKDAETPR
jgi:hypothetical protein